MVEENSVLKAQVEEFQAESALHSMQVIVGIITGGGGGCC